jgi:phosphoserine phosphatase
LPARPRARLSLAFALLYRHGARLRSRATAVVAVEVVASVRRHGRKWLPDQLDQWAQIPRTDARITICSSPPKEMTSPCAIDGASFCTLPSMEGLENGAKAQTT